MIGIVLGTGPSLNQSAPLIPKIDGLLFGINNTFEDFNLDAWIACDPAWHAYYGQVEGSFDKWYWQKDICDRYGYRYIEGGWMVNGEWYSREQYETPPGPAGGLWLKDKTRISLNHCSSAQALNLAAHYDCDPILLVGHDFNYNGQRHYFTDLSDTPGEYPGPLRKWSEFNKKGKGDDLLAVYKRIADQPGRPEIINCTPGSKLPWFPRAELKQYA